VSGADPVHGCELVDGGATLEKGEEMTADVKQVLMIIAFAAGIILAVLKRTDLAIAAVSAGLLVGVL
jgi:hypothetical protein